MNILLRVRLAYRTLNEKGGHDYAAIYLSMIICIFYIGCWSLLGLLLPYKLTSFPFPVWAFLWLFLSVASVYFSCIWKDGYVRANDFLNTIPQVQKKRVEIRNGLLLVLISILPQVVALGAMLSKSVGN